MQNVNLIRSAVPYEGNVTVKIRIKDKVVDINGHNQAEYLLKKLFTQVITGNVVGQYNALAKTPQFLNISKQTNGEWESILISPVVFTSKEYVFENDNWVAKMSAVVQHGNLIDSIDSSDTSNFRLELLADRKLLSEIENETSGGILATMQNPNFNATVLAKIAPGTSGIFEWQLQLIDVNE